MPSPPRSTYGNASKDPLSDYTFTKIETRLLISSAKAIQGLGSRRAPSCLHCDTHRRICHARLWSHRLHLQDRHQCSPNGSSHESSLRLCLPVRVPCRRQNTYTPALYDFIDIVDSRTHSDMLSSQSASRTRKLPCPRPHLPLRPELRPHASQPCARHLWRPHGHCGDPQFNRSRALFEPFVDPRKARNRQPSYRRRHRHPGRPRGHLHMHGRILPHEMPSPP